MYIRARDALRRFAPAMLLDGTFASLLAVRLTLSLKFLMVLGSCMNSKVKIQSFCLFFLLGGHIY